MSQISGTLQFCSICLARFSNISDPLISENDRVSYTVEKLKDNPSQVSLIPSPQDSCYLCNGIFLKMDKIYAALHEELNDVEYSTFLLGARTSPEQDQIEKTVSECLGYKVEPLSKEFKREFGKYLEKRDGKTVSFDEPDLLVLFDLRYFSFDLQIRPVFVYGTYTKIKRGIPQTRWIHRKDVDDSVETQIGDCLNSITMGSECHLHGAGREDVDVLMLGNGREFIIESEKPRKRKFDLKELEKCVNEVSDSIRIGNLRTSNRKEVVSLKDSTFDKTYRATISSALPFNGKKLENAVLYLSGKDIYQRTPLRVTGSRSDLVRTRRIVSLKLDSVAGSVASITVRAQAGTYIKEMIHGDEGRTKPSLAEIYGEDIGVKELDVIWIHRE